MRPDWLARIEAAQQIRAYVIGGESFSAFRMAGKKADRSPSLATIAAFSATSATWNWSATWRSVLGVTGRSSDANALVAAWIPDDDVARSAAAPAQQLAHRLPIHLGLNAIVQLNRDPESFAGEYVKIRP